MPDDALRPIVDEACASIINHYSDPIHCDLPPESAGKDADADADAERIDGSYAQNNGTDTEAPYFDSNLGQPMPGLAPVCRFWHQRLLEASSQKSSISANRNASLDAAYALLRRYESSIHICMKRSNKAAHDIRDEDNKLRSEVPFNAKVEILRNYELLLAHLMRDASAKSILEEVAVKKGCNNLIEVDNGFVIKDADSVNEKCFDELKISPRFNTQEVVCVIADDIFQWSTMLPKKDKEVLWKIQNVLLPCFLRLLEHSVALFASFKQDMCKSIFNAQLRDVLAISTVTAISFVGDGKLRSGVVRMGSLLNWIFERTNSEGHLSSPMPSLLSVEQTVLQNCPLSTRSKTEESNLLPRSIMSSNFMARSVVDWSVPSAQFDAPWTDGVTGVGSRVAMGVLRVIHQSSCCALSPSMEEVDVNNCSRNATPPLRLLLRELSQNIGVDLLASTVRAHFFGRLPRCFSSDANTKVQSQASGVFMPMVKRIGSNHHQKAADVTASSDDEPHIDIPMRLSAAATILCAALHQPCNNFEMWDKVFSDAVPIAMSLLDDAQPLHQAIGALIFISVTEAAASFELEGSPSFVKKFSSVVTSSLESSIHLCGRESPTFLTIICLAQSKWIKYLEFCSRKPDTALSPSGVHLMARKAVADMILAIWKQAQTGGRDSNDERVAGVLVGGINPLLGQLASCPEAASVEIARVGLSTLLAVIGWSGMRLDVRSAQISALVGLMCLMDGAHPIMPLHGKKIMTEVFLLMERADKDAAFLSNDKTADSINGKNMDGEVSTDATFRAAVYAASVALTLCGRSAEVVLQHISSNHSSRKHLLNRCIEIRATSKQLRSNIY